MVVDFFLPLGLLKVNMATATKTLENENDAAQEAQHTVQPKTLDPEVVRFRDTLEVDTDAVKPQWALVSRLMQLYRGKLPEELNGTFSKIMLNTAFAIVQERIGLLHRNLFAKEEGSPSLEADDPYFELLRPQAEDWLRSMVHNPSKLNMPAEFLARTLPEVCVAGTAFRMPYVARAMDPKRKGRYVSKINSKHVDFFQIIPAANGGQINPIDREAEDCLSHFHWVDWWTDDQIKGLEKYKGFDKNAAASAINAKATNNEDLEQSYREIGNIVGGVDFGGQRNDWRMRMADIGGDRKGRKRVVFWFERDKLTIIVQDRWKIYSGDGPIPDRKLPLAVYHCSPFGNSIYGISGIEMVEDLIRAMMMNFNFRQDYLAKLMFPTKWIRSDIVAAKSKSSFQDTPYGVHEFPVGTNIKEALYIDRMPEITPQSFQDEAAYKQFLQDNYGLTDYSRGSPGRITDNRTATGLVSMIQQAQGRLTTESYILEKFGLTQELTLILSFGAKYILEDQDVRTSRHSGGFNWSSVEAEAITDSYTVHTHGTRYMQEKDQSFQKVMQLYPLWNQDPMIDQFELRKQTAEAAAVFQNLERLIVEPPPMPEGDPTAATGESLGQGTMAPNNREGRMQERTSVLPDGNAEPATEAF
tara:strand:- start:3898 stop:5820 length:1923 start_codon:yes stop_codon:yes gene_type:complete